VTVGAASFGARYGPWALVAGASMGLGAEYARQIAARGLDVVLVAWPAEGLEEVARDLERRYAIQTRCIVLDLADRAETLRLAETTRDLEIGLVVYNAAFSDVGPFLRQDLEGKIRGVDVNCAGPLILAHAFAGPMVERGRGGIILMSSLSAFHGTPLVASYAATKAFNLTLGEALFEELRPSGVDVLVVCPGATRTPGWERSRPHRRGFLAPSLMEPAPVVSEALEALGRRPVLIAGRANRLLGLLLHRLMPRRRAVELLARSMRRLYPG
jgi:short-subunit dehydrogenase